MDPSSAKRKRVVNAKDDDINIGTIKELVTTTDRGRVNSRVRKCVFHCSPSSKSSVLTLATPSSTSESIASTIPIHVKDSECIIKGV